MTMKGYLWRMPIAEYFKCNEIRIRDEYVRSDYVVGALPDKRDTLNQCYFNVGQQYAGLTLNQHWFNVSCNRQGGS